MFQLPEKHSKKWLYHGIGIFLITFFALLVNAVLLAILSVETSIIYALVSLFVALAISGGGYLGAKTYFYTALFFNIIGIIYMLYISINQAAEGWSDLVSMISYFFIMVIGILIGLVAEGIKVLIAKTKH